MTVREVEYRDVAGIRTAVADRGDGPPVIFVHGVPDSLDEWAPFLDRAGELGRVIAPDLPGFGRSGRPGHIDFAVLKMWFAALVDDLGLERYRLVVHDWGAVALAAAALRPEQVERLVVINAVALTRYYRWHWLARAWRTPVVGELATMGMRRPVLKVLTRLSSPRPGPMSDEFLDDATRYLDAGTRRAILGLYRSADADVLDAAGKTLDEVRCPSLVLWGDGDPYLGTEEAYRFGAVLPNSEVEMVRNTGHWCFREDPAVVDRVIKFLGAG